MFKIVLASLVFTLAACGTSEGRREAAPEPATPPSALTAAHEAYLAGDYIATGEHVRDVLLDPNATSLARENALELIEKTFEENGQVPTRTTLPEGITGAVFGARRGFSTFGTYRSMFLWMRVKDGLSARMGDVRVERVSARGKEVLCERNGKKTLFKIAHNVPGFEDVVLDAFGFDALPADGVFTVRVDVDGKPALDTWFIGRRLEATAAPDVTVVPDASPVIRFAPFRSPEHASFEQRSLGVYVEDEATKRPAFDLYTQKPDELAGKVQVASKLASGSYWLAFTANEERIFGPLHISRGSQAGVRFVVAR